MDDDQAPSTGKLTRTGDAGTCSIALEVRGETRVLGALLISWPRHEFYRANKDFDYRARLDS